MGDFGRVSWIDGELASEIAASPKRERSESKLDWKESEEMGEGVRVRVRVRKVKIKRR